jgi:SAM-dependent methyltransferase
MAKHPATFLQRWRHWWHLDGNTPAIGCVRMGTLRRLHPIGAVFGLHRGHDLQQCIDRYYITDFLSHHAADIHGHVLEVAENLYTHRFGGDRVVRADILHVAPDHPEATIVADLTCADHLPSDTFHCIILTQTLQYIYDVRLALRTLYRLLQPGGILLLTCPGISQMSPHDREQWGEYWRFTTMSLRKLLAEVFPAEHVDVKSYGNVLTAIAFLHGLIIADLRPAELTYHDPNYELVVTGRVVKPLAPPDLEP